MAGKRREKLIEETERRCAQLAGLESLAVSMPGGVRGCVDERRLFAALMDHIPDNIYFKDTKSRFTLINRALCNLFKLSDPSESVGKTDFDFFTHEHAARAYADDQRVIRSGRAIVGKEEKETWPDGRETWVSTTKVPLRDESGRVVGTFGISRDITAHKHAESELQRHRAHLEQLVMVRTGRLSEANAKLRREIVERRRAEDQLRQQRDRARMYLDIAGTMIVVLDRKGRVALMNRKGCEILGCSEKSIVGQDWFATVLPAGSVSRVKQGFRRLMKGEGAGDQHFENEVLTRQGAARLIAWHNAVLRDERGKIIGTLSSGEDITQRRQAEQALLQSERMEAVGTLAIGVALSVSNIISVINGQAAFIAANFIPKTRPHEAATRILDATRHATELARRLMGVAKASVTGLQFRREIVSLRDVAQETLNLVAQPFAERKVGVLCRDLQRMPSVSGDPGELLDVLMVLLMNAADAMPSGGTIALSAGVRTVLRPPSKLNAGARPGDFAVVCVRDTGVGIGPENLSRLFDPAFTTKSAGSSSGLGMLFVRDIVLRMGGWVTVQSREGKGTSFRLFMPKAEVQEAVAGVTDKARLTQGRCVLVADDQPEELALMRDTLRRAGYKVCPAQGPDEAVRMFREHAGKIALCVVDAFLPGLDRHALLKEIAGASPEVDLIMTSGFSREYVRNVAPPGAWGFLQKPFEPEQLLDVVNDAVLQRVARERGGAAG